MEESLIVINGKTLTAGQAITIRVALENFALMLTKDDGPIFGIEMHYMDRIQEIRRTMNNEHNRLFEAKV